VPEYQLQEGLYEYSSELCIYLRQLEERFVLHKDFLEGGSINQGMRAMVVNWIIEVRQFSGRQQIEPCVQNRHLLNSVADPDPGSGAFLTPGSGIGFFQIPDSGSRIPDPKPHIFESIFNFFLGKNFNNSLKLAQIFFFSISKIT
jgi:hypothetical protein